MTSLKVIAPNADTASRLEGDILSTVYQKLAEFNFEPVGTVAAAGHGNVFALNPTGDVVMETENNVVTVKVRHADLDEKDLFISVLADLEERNDGVTGEID